MKKNKLASLLLISILAFSSLTGCTTKPKEVPNAGVVQYETENVDLAFVGENTSLITITDQIGREVIFEKPAEKLVSSYYISTAIFVALGLEDSLIGIEAKADTRGLYKMAAPNLLSLPAIGTGKGVNVEEVAALNPDVVVIPKKLADSVESFESLGIPVIVVNPETMEEFRQCIAILAEVTATQDKATALLDYYDDKTNQVFLLNSRASNLPKVYLSSGSDYFSTCTSKMYQNDLISISGGDNVSKELTDGYWQIISAEQLNIWQPDYMFAVSYADYSLDDIKNDVALSELTAVKEGNVYYFPSAIEPWDYPTPSSVLGMLYLTQVLHPDLYSQEQFVDEATSFYKEFFDIDVTLEDLGL